MTKQPPYVTKLHLSKICRWLMTLGIAKLCIFGALVVGYPLPELSLDFEQPKEKAQTVAPVKEMAAVTSAPAVAAEQSPAPLPEPQGAAAARAASTFGTAIPPAALVAASPDLPLSDKVPAYVPLSEDEIAAVATGDAPVSATVVSGTPSVQVASAGIANSVADTAATPRPAGDKSWWTQVLQVKQLPFPRLGLDQVAHAATLDSPPSPALPAPAPDSSPFVPPAQSSPRGQNTDSAQRAATSTPLPAGTAGPQINQPQNDSVSTLLTPPSTPPAPRVGAYTPPEDPNRKQQELARREQEVLALKQQMEQRLEELQSAERKVQSLLEAAKAEEAKKASKLAQIYTNMKPKQAAKALESLDERTAVKILAGMSSKQSGEILTYADPVKTAKLTELISRMRAGQ